MADALAWFQTLCVVLVLVALLRLATLLQRTARLSRLEAKVDLLLQNAGISYDPYKGVPESVVQAIRDGNKIAAIKAYQDATGVGLKEAKAFVEEAQSRLPR